MSRYKQKYVVTNVKYSPSVMVWGCFSARKGRGFLFFLPPKMMMNSSMCISVLREKLFPWMATHGVTKFLHDGAPCHTSKVSMALLKEQPFIVMDWLGNSPDLNPIENLWSIMKARLNRDHTITPLPKLERAIKMMWVMGLPCPCSRSWPTASHWDQNVFGEQGSDLMTLWFISEAAGM